MTLTQIQRAGIAATAKDMVSILDYIPIALHAAIRAGTSTTDVTQYIQDALTYSSTKARAVFFPAGCYKCSSGIVLQTGAKLIGEALEKSEYNIHKGTGTVIQFTGSAGITAVSKNKIEFYNIAIRGSNTFSANYVVKFDAVYACRFHNVVISNEGTHSNAGGLFMDDNDDSDSTPTDYAWSNFFDNCLFSAPKTAGAKGYTFYFTGSDSWFNNIYSSGGLGIFTKPGGNNWSNLHCEHAFSGSAKSATGTAAGFTVDVATYSHNFTKLINVNNIYCDISDIAIKWVSSGDGSLHAQYNFSNVLCRGNENCDFKFENSGTSSPNQRGGSIVGYHSQNPPSQPIKVSGTILKPFIQTEGNSLTDIKIGIETGSPNVKLDVGGSSTNGLAGLTNPTFYTGFAQDSTTFAGVVLGSGPNGNQPFIAASKSNNGNANDLRFYTNSTQRLLIRGDQAGICFGSDNSTQNCLDDYEEGDWTVTPTGQIGETDVSIHSNENKLSYNKIGNLVIVKGRIRLNTVNFSGALRISLPFTVASDSNTNNKVGCYVATHGADFGSDHREMFLQPLPNAAKAEFSITRDNAGWVSATNNIIKANTYLAFALMYTAA